MLIEHSMNIEQSLIFNLNSKVPSIILELATFPWKFYVQKKKWFKVERNMIARICQIHFVFKRNSFIFYPHWINKRAPA